MGYTLSSFTMFNLFQTYVYFFLHFYSTLTKLYNQVFFKGEHVLFTLFTNPTVWTLVKVVKDGTR